jgi:hypothetical protein
VTGPPSLFDADGAADVLRCRASWLREKARRREIPFTMVGGSYRWTADHLAEIVRLFEQSPAPQTPRRRAMPAGEVVTQLLRARPPRRRNAGNQPAA